MRRLFALVAALVLAFAACSGGGGKNQAKSKEGKAVEQAVKSAGGDFCKLAANLDQLEDLDSTALTADQVAEIEDAMEALFASMPDELKSQVDLDLFRRQIEAFRAYMDATGGGTTAEPTPAQQKKLDEVKEEFADLPERQDEIDADQAKVNSYLETECGQDQDGDGDTDGKIEP